MLLPPKIAAGVADGSVTLAYRRWAEPRVKVGGRFLTSAGLIEVTSVAQVADDSITPAEAVGAGATSATEVLRLTKGGPDVPLYRVGLTWAGPDPRVALRESAELTDDDVQALIAKLARLDKAGSFGAWTFDTLGLIEQYPQRRAPDLAAMVGRETAPFKIDVRKLKGLGLTRSFDIGYELSPRGREFLRRARSLG
ncbi:MAG TPA: hypothetical protein VF479_00085 [Pseudolysinimonas sp.]